MEPSFTSAPSKAPRYALFAVIALVTCIALLYTFENWRGERVWRAYLEKAAQRGEKTSLADYVPPHVPDAENFAKTPYLVAKGYRKGSKNLDGFPVKFSQDIWQQLGSFRKGTFTRFDLSTASPDPMPSHAEGVDLIFNQLEPARREMDELRAAAKLPYSRFDTEGRFDEPIPNFVVLRSAAQAFQFHALASLYSGKVDAAFEDLLVIHKFADGLRGHPTLVASMIRVALLGLEKQTFYEGWALGKWTPEQYEKFEKIYRSADCLLNVDTSMRGGERFGVRDLFERHSVRELIDAFHFGPFDAEKQPWRAWAAKGLLRSLPKGWWSQNLAVQHTLIDETVAASYDLRTGRIFPRPTEEASNGLEAKIDQHKPHHYLSAIAIPNMGKAMRRVAEIQATSDQAAIVCALERFRSARGTYPETLANLVPDFIPALPKDLVSGQPSKYRRNTDGTFLLYNVGWNEIDEEGTIAIDPDIPFLTGDLVWPFLKNIKSAAK